MNDVLIDWGVYDGVRYTAHEAREQEEIDEIYRLRYRVYCEELQQVPRQQFPDGREIDHCDAHSRFVAVKADGKVIGCLRLIDCAKGCLLTDSEFDGKKFSLTTPLETTVECSRWIGYAVPLRDGTRLLISNLALEAGLRLARRYGATDWIWALKHSAYENLKREGWNFKDFLPGVWEYHGSRVVVCGVPVAEHPCRRVLPSKEV